MHSFGFKLLTALAILSLSHCVELVDPGYNARYDVAFSSPALVAGKKFRWKSMPVKIRHLPCSVSGCSAGLEAAVKRGIAFWQNNASLFGEIQTAFGEPAAIEISYASALAGNQVGHCLGLWTHSPNEGDLMYSYLTDRTGYTARDLNSLRYLYSQDTDLGVVTSGQLGQHYQLTGEIVSSPSLQP